MQVLQGEEDFTNPKRNPSEGFPSKGQLAADWLSTPLAQHRTKAAPNGVGRMLPNHLSLPSECSGEEARCPKAH